MKVLLIKTILFLCISLTVLCVLGFMYEKKAGDIYIDKPSYVIHAKKANYDYIAGGSSRVHNNFNTRLCDSVTGLHGFNIAYSGSALAENYVTLHLFLQNGNRVKNYILQVEDAFLADPHENFSYPFHDYFFMHEIGDRKVDEAYLKSVPAVKFYAWKYIPYLKYAEFNNYYKLRFLYQPSKTDSAVIRHRGYERLDKIHALGFPKPDYTPQKEERKADPVSLYYLEEIRQLCQQNNIRFIIYSSPVYKQASAAYKHTELHKTLVDFCTRHAITYLDFMQDPNYTTELFYDETHLNSMGTDKFTVQLADSLKNIFTQQHGIN